MGLRIGGWSLMKKYDLLRSGDNIIRILDFQDDRILMIDPSTDGATSEDNGTI